MKHAIWFALAVALASTGCNGDAARAAEIVREAARARAASEANRVLADRARAQGIETQRAAQAAQDEVASLETSRADLDAHIDSAVDAIASAETEADRAAANAKLQALRMQKTELDARIEATKAARAHPGSAAGTGRVDCLTNPLARGCP